MRITIRIEREEDPLVFDILSMIPKGPSRANRAKTLLHDGALMQGGGFVVGRTAERFEEEPAMRVTSAAGIFDEAIAE